MNKLFIASLSVLGLCFTINAISYDDVEEMGELDMTTKLVEEIEESNKLDEPNHEWIGFAIKQIALYLRHHKYNEWDRRLGPERPRENVIGFYRSFPSPPLDIHWKVKERCRNDFIECVKYLGSVISESPLLRFDEAFSELINNIHDSSDKACVESNTNERKSLPFDSPMELFKWRTSASYYMCWYTMLENPLLLMLNENCDDFALCGSKNRDPRANNRKSFACALYSFCPDICCPLKHVIDIRSCLLSETNPCYYEEANLNDVERNCNMNRKDNTNFNDMIHNRWNVSCACKEKGFKWKSKYGMCVDVNECLIDDNNKCNASTEDCINLPGKYKCLCKWGYEYDKVNRRCSKVVMPIYYSKENESC